MRPANACKCLKIVETSTKQKRNISTSAFTKKHENVSEHYENHMKNKNSVYLLKINM